MSEREQMQVSTRISGELKQLFKQYREERGYNKSETAKRLMEDALLKENNTSLQRLADLRQELRELERENTRLEDKLNGIEERVEGDDVQSSRIGNLEERVKRLETIEWETRRELKTGDGG